ncbi:MAG TPA: hypothetical protein VFW76_13930 [Ktedonobacterales bacterium]|nr:hypothetical protein [Ktedonobacterales bacterium]
MKRMLHMFRALASDRRYRLLLTMSVAILSLAASLSPLGVAVVRAAPARPLSGCCVDAVHTATAENSYYDFTLLTDLVQGYDVFADPNMVITVTATWDPNGNCGCVYDTHTLGVWYNGNRWAIFHEDQTPIPLGATYNLLTMFAHNSIHNAYTHTATLSNSSGNSTYLDDPGANFSPNAVIIATQNLSPSGQSCCVFNNHPIGVWFTGSYWAVFNENNAPIPVGASFNVLVEPVSTFAIFTQRATSAYYIDYINNAWINNHPQRMVFVTPNWNPAGQCPCMFDTHPLGVYYDTYYAQWSIYHQDIAPMSVGEAFNVFAVG